MVLHEVLGVNEMLRTSPVMHLSHGVNSAQEKTSCSDTVNKDQQATETASRGLSQAVDITVVSQV